MALFKRKHIKKIFEGRKTQTRRIHKHTWKVGKVYGIRDRWYSKAEGYILITRKFRQKLGDISPEGIKREGYNSLKQFRREWEEIHGKGSWNPEQVVIVYEFKVVNDGKVKVSSGKL